MARLVGLSISALIILGANGQSTNPTMDIDFTSNVPPTGATPCIYNHEPQPCIEINDVPATDRMQSDFSCTITVRSHSARSRPPSASHPH